MSQKNQNSSENESTEFESSEADTDLTQPGATSPDTNPEEQATESSVEDGEYSAESPAAASGDEETSSEDLLEDVRRSLIEEEGSKDKKESKWWRRIGRRAKKAERDQPSVPADIDLPSIPTAIEPVSEQSLVSEPQEQEVDQIDDLIDLLKSEEETGTVGRSVVPEVETPSEPEPEIDFEELKKQAFQPRVGEEEADNNTDVRSIALEGGEEVLVEVEAKPVNPVEERISAVENALKPYRQYIYIALALLGVGIAVFASLIIYRVYQQSRPQPVQEVSNLPYPASVSLPGGWSFKLGKGALQNGIWEPKGPEWLQGTEVCRWLALPWSRQLEAVIRTLNPKDPIQLTMSNNDQFTYEVYSVRQLTPEEMQKLDSNSACLLLILTQPDAEKRWVLTALP
jgi:hypothetical protein